MKASSTQERWVRIRPQNLLTNHLTNMATAKKVTKAKKPRTEAEKITTNLGYAKEIMEHKQDGFVLIAKITKDPKGFVQEGAAITHNVSSLQIAQVVMNNFDMEALDFIIAGHALNKVVDMSKGKKKSK